MNQSAELQQVKEYCYNHKLVRPKINWPKFILVVTSYFMLSALLVTASVLLTGHLFLWVVDVSLVLPLLAYGNVLGIVLIEIYQRYASERVRRQCSCQPSCSEYATLAFRKYYWMKALYLTWRRVFFTCAKPGYHLDYP
ncbi:membrane protein insertion efficiency factor YidD [Prevotella salivae]|jgi:putative alpha-hemolysin|uniref:Membrane protein insertion efficiency factor YidD n=1 Tax=Segatella salivae TaxID=228604 RepID=A0AAW4NSL3_9BACT|nr:membrane protein insertion efficiency factor YidD [Segatella salivae]MBW4867019.1 membrane protein insertion efficiency factor YidD [Segatella salivae]MBW4909832.1 membrane protein insertion efficiency factor YidD [Segatella salivae]